MQVSTIFRAARPPFLALTPVCILLGYALARLQTSTISLTDTALIFIGALAAHIAVNLLNEYQDFISGLDLTTVKTPFSGGSGALPDDPNSSKAVLAAAIINLAIVCLIGLYFLFTTQGWTLPLIGLGGIILILTYTKWVNRRPVICLLAPGLGFGSFMVLGCVLLLSNTISALAVVLSLVPFCQINNLLLLNQFPDIEADRQVGRNHFPIAFGPTAAAKVYGLLMMIPFAIIGSLILSQTLPLLALIALLPLIAGVIVFRAVVRYEDNIASHPKYLGMNVALTLATPVLLSIAVLIG
jgi:1,4-dihydroxy-2-naphthoate octaprenyltransferase